MINIVECKNAGSRPNHCAKSSGSIARKALQALEKLKLVEKDPNGGRILTSQVHCKDSSSLYYINCEKDPDTDPQLKGVFVGWAFLVNPGLFSCRL